MKILVVRSDCSEEITPDLNKLEENFPQQLYWIVVAEQAEFEPALAQGPFALALIPYRLEWTNGLHLLAKLQQRFPHMAVIMFTALGSEEIAVQGMKAGLSDYLTPASLERLPQTFQDITRQKQIEEELRQGQRTLSTILDTLADHALLLDPDGKILFVDQSLAQSLGQPADELIGKYCNSFLPGSLVEIRWAKARKVFETGQYERSVDPINGTWFDHSIYPIFDVHGKVMQVAILARDVSEYKKAEQELLQSYRTIQALIQVPTDVVLLVDRQKKISLANETLEHSLKRTSEDIIGKTLEELLPPALAEAQWTAIRQVFESGKPVRFTDRGIGGWFDNSVYPIHDDQGKVIQVAVIARDITEHIAAEEKLRQSYKTIQVLMNLPTDIIVLVDTQANILMTNENLAKVFGKTPEEMTGLNIAEILPSSTSERRKTYFAEVLRTGQAVHFQDEGFNGTYFDHIIYPILRSDGQVDQVAILSRDITDIKQAAEAVRQKEAMLRMVVNSAPLALMAIDLNGTITLADGKALLDLGYSSAHLMGQNVFHIFARRAHIIETVWQVLNEQTIQNIEQQIGKHRFQMVFIPTFDIQGHIAGATGIAIDITALHKTQDELRQSRDQLQFILTGVADGITVINTKRELIYANEAAARRLGFRSVEEYVNSPGTARRLDIWDEAGWTIPPEKSPGWRILEGRENPPLTVQYQRIGSSEKRWAEVMDRAVLDEHNNIQMVVTITHDITELKHIQQSLEKARDALEVRVAERTVELDKANQELHNQIARAEALLRIASRLNASLDLQEVLQTICEEAIRATGYTISSLNLYDQESDSLYVAAAAGQDISLRPQFQPVPRQMFEDYVKTFGPEIVIPDLMRISGQLNFEIYQQARVRTMIVITLYHEGKLMGNLSVASQDNTRLPEPEEMRLLQGLADQASLTITNARLFAQVSESQQRLRALSQQLVETQESERRRLARELHDEIGTMLTALNMNLERVQQNWQESIATGSNNPGSEMQRVHETIDQLLDQVRKMTLDLRPPMLDDLGLLPALLTYFERYTDKMKVSVHFRHSGVFKRYPPQIETAAFRIIQEALTNVARHAHIREADVHLWANAQILGVQVEDQGAGFDLGSAQSSGTSSGLSGMRERAELCGGWLEIETYPQNGTCVTAEFPLSEDCTNDDPFISG